MRPLRTLAATLLALLALGAASAQALTLQSVGDFDQPIYVTSDPGNSNRLFVVERDGDDRSCSKTGSSTNSPTSAARSNAAPNAAKASVGCSRSRSSPTFDTDGRLYVDYGNDVDGTSTSKNFSRKDAGHRTADTRPCAHWRASPTPDQQTTTAASSSSGPTANSISRPATGAAATTNSTTPRTRQPAREDPPDRPRLGRCPPHVWSYGLRNPYPLLLRQRHGRHGDRRRRPGQPARRSTSRPVPPPSVVGGDGANYGWNCREGFIAGPGDDPAARPCPPRTSSNPSSTTRIPPTPISAARTAARYRRLRRPRPRPRRPRRQLRLRRPLLGRVRSLQLPASARRASGDCSLGLTVDKSGLLRRRRGPTALRGRRRWRGLPPRPAPRPPCPVPTPTALAAADEQACSSPPDRDQGPAAAGRTRQGGAADRLRLPLRRPQRGPGRAPAQRPAQRHPLPQPCLHRPLPTPRPSGTTFSAVTRGDREYVAGKSRKLTIRLAPRRRHR